MNTHKLLFVLTLLFFAASCGEKQFEYKYQDRPQISKCTEPNKPLLFEAMYSFREDVAAKYNDKRFDKGSLAYYQNGYANFVFRASEGTVNVENVASPHTLEIAKRLKEETALWDFDNEKSNLNYKSDYVYCLIRNIKSPVIKNMIQQLNAVGSLSPEIMADLYRKNIGLMAEDQYLEMFIALDVFYQRLMESDAVSQNAETDPS